jgi:hypothetical protein
VERYCLEAYTIENRKGCGVLLFGSLYKGGKIDTDVKYHLCGGYVKYHLFRKSTLGRIIDTDVEWICLAAYTIWMWSITVWKLILGY